MRHPHNPHPHNPDAQGCTEIVIQPSPEANDSRPATCSPLDDATREEILAMVFDPKMEQASVGIIWERLRRKYGALLPAECLIYYSENGGASVPPLAESTARSCCPAEGGQEDRSTEAPPLSPPKVGDNAERTGQHESRESTERND